MSGEQTPWSVESYEAMAWRQVPHEDGCRAVADPERDCGCLRSLVLDARSWARHGYEVGQKTGTWSDAGVAPRWLTEEHSHFAWPSDDTPPAEPGPASAAASSQPDA